MQRMKDWLPSDYYPGLKRQRLRIVADLLNDARNGAVDDHRPETGESSWSVGVRGYERGEVSVIRGQVKYEWLRVVNGVDAGPSMFVFKIGIHPIRFLHGTPDDIPAKYEKPVLPEIEEMQQALALDGALPKYRILRMCVDTNPHTLRVKRIVLAELNEATGQVLNQYLIRENEAQSAAAPVVPFAPPAPPPQGVTLQAPDVTVKGVKKEKEEDE
jgi:hypothetical protein